MNRFLFFISLFGFIYSETCSADDILTPLERRYLESNLENIATLIETSSPPDSFLNSNGAPQGLMIDYLSALENVLDVTFKRKIFQNWNGLMTRAKNRRLFFIIGIVNLESRRDLLSFTDTINKVPYVIVSQTDSPMLLMSDLANKTVCTPRHYAIETHLKQFYAHFTLKIQTSPLENVRSVSTGHCDVTIINQMYLSYLIQDQKFSNLKIVGESGFEARVSIGISKQDPLLTKILHKALDKIDQNQRQKMLDRWLYSEEKTNIWPWLGVLLSLFSLVLTVVLYRSSRLRKEATYNQSQLEIKDAEFRNYIENAPYAVFVLDENYHFITANSRIEELTEYPREQLLGTDCFILVRPDRREPGKKILAHTPIGEKSHVHTVITTKSGKQKDLSLDYVRLTDSQHLLFATDITERRELIAERRRLFLAIECAADSVAILDQHRHIQYTNKAYAAEIGYSKEELLGKFVEDLKPVDFARDQIFEIRETLAEGKPWVGRVLNKKKDGTLYTRDSSITPVAGPSGDLEYYISVGRDISRQIAMEKERAELEIQNHHAQRLDSIGRLAGGVSHDLNNLLIPILCYSELLQGAHCTDAERQDFASQILKAGHRAKDLVSSLLSYSRKQTFETRVLCMKEILQDMKSILETTLSEQLQLRTELPASPVYIQADASKLEQVIMNLVINAAASMSCGGDIIIRLSSRYVKSFLTADGEMTSSDNYVVLEIVDTGCGMDEQTQSKIFEPFFTTKGELGTGLGLATVYGIVKQHRGLIRLDSEIGKGTRFTILFPTAAYVQSQEMPIQTKTPSLRGEETILLAEDDEVVRRLARNILRRQGYDVLSARDGEEAWRLYQTMKAEIDLIVTDVMMPKMNGQDLLRQIRACQPQAKFLYMSGYTGEHMSGDPFVKLDAEFLQKPFSNLSLSTKVRQVLDRTH